MAKYFILTLSLAVILFSACSKKATPSTASHMDMLRKGKWRVSGGTLTVKLPDGRDTVLDYMKWIPVCHRDDYFVFNTPTTGAVFNGGMTCTPGDPDSISLNWKFIDNDKYLSLYNSFHLYYAVRESIMPFEFDTLQWTPNLVLDTIHGVLDTAEGYTRTVIVLDTIWKLHFDTASVVNTDIFNAPITNFTQNSFNLYFTLLSQFPDSTNHQTGQFNFGGVIVDTFTVYRQDTFKYKLTYTNY